MRQQSVSRLICLFLVFFLFLLPELAVLLFSRNLDYSRLVDYSGRAKALLNDTDNPRLISFLLLDVFAIRCSLLKKYSQRSRDAACDLIIICNNKYTRNLFECANREITSLRLDRRKEYWSRILSRRFTATYIILYRNSKGTATVAAIASLSH